MTWTYNAFFLGFYFGWHPQVSSRFSPKGRHSSLSLWTSLDPNPQMLHHWVLGDPGCEGNAFPTPQPQLLGASKCKFRCLAATHHHTPCNHLPHGRRDWCGHSTCLNLGPLVDPSVTIKPCTNWTHPRGCGSLSPSASCMAVHCHHQPLQSPSGRFLLCFLSASAWPALLRQLHPCRLDLYHSKPIHLASGLANQLENVGQRNLRKQQKNHKKQINII